MSAVLSPPPAPVPAAAPWRPALLALGAAVLLLATLYGATAAGMVGIWYRSETFAHAFLVPPIVLWLIWRQRQALAATVPQPAPWMLLPLAGAALLWLLAELVLVNAALHFAWVALLVLAVPTLLGWQVTGVILFPLLFTFFAVPFGEFMLDPMMLWTADFTVWALQLTGIPVYREGLHFVIPSGRWSVVEECSGVRYLIASFMVGTLFAYLNYRSWRRRAVFMLISIIVPIVANWLRAYMIVMLGHLSGNTIAVGVDHLLYGWVFFGVVVMIMFLIGARWAEPDESVEEAVARQQAHRQAAADSDPAGESSAARRALPTALGVMLLLVLPHLVLWGLERAERSAAAPELALPSVMAGGWAAAAPQAPSAAYRPRFFNPSVEALTHYAPAADAGAAPVGVYLAYYRAQRGDAKLVSSVNSLVPELDSGRWNQVATGAHRAGGTDAELQVRTARLLGHAVSGAGQRADLTLWRVYWIDGRWVAGDARAKLVNAWARLRGRGDDGAVLVLWTDDDNRERATARLERFARDNLGAIDALLHSTRAAR